MLINNKVPNSIRFIFENLNLYILQYLTVLYIILLRKRKTTSEEVMFYNILSLLDETITQETLLKEKDEFQYLYFKLEKHLSEILLILNNLGLIKVFDNGRVSKFKIEVAITDKGKKMISDIDSDYFLEIKNRVAKLKQEVVFKTTLFKELKGEKN